MVYTGYMDKRKRMNSKGGLTDIFLFLIFTIIIVFVSGIMIYIGIISQEALHENLDDMPLNSNVSEVIDNSFDEVNLSYSMLYWISLLIIIGMVMSIFIGNYLVETHPVFFIPYIFVMIIAIVVSVAITIAYNDFLNKITEYPQLSEVFAGFVGANFIIAWLPLWVTGIGFVGGVIMFTRLGRSEQLAY